MLPLLSSQGLAGAVLSTFPTTAVFFATSEWTRNQFEQHWGMSRYALHTLLNLTLNPRDP